MQLSSDSEVEKISQKTNFAIIELPESSFDLILPKASHFEPNEKGIYSKDDIDNISSLVHSKQTDELTLVLENAEKMNESAANTFLKTLEEPGDRVHFIFLVKNASEILPTIKSRAQNYYLPKIDKINNPPQVSPEILDLAKKYISCKPKDLPKFCDTIAKDKKDARAKALAVVDASIQLVYKSYFITSNQQFIDKLNNLLETYDAIRSNGHIKLQLIAGMV